MRFPKGEPHVQAAKEAPLEDAWWRAEPQNLKKTLRKRITELRRNHRLIGTTELGYQRIVSLETPSDGAFSDSGKSMTLGEALADPSAVEDFVLGALEFQDPASTASSTSSSPESGKSPTYTPSTTA